MLHFRQPPASPVPYPDISRRQGDFRVAQAGLHQQAELPVRQGKEQGLQVVGIGGGQHFQHPPPEKASSFVNRKVRVSPPRGRSMVLVISRIRVSFLIPMVRFALWGS